MFKGKVSLSKSMKYQIYSTARSQVPYGEILSRTEVDALNSTVIVFDSGKVVIKTEQGRVEYDINTGKIAVL